MTAEPSGSKEVPEWYSLLENYNPTSQEDTNDLLSTWKGKSSGTEVPEFGWRIALSHKFKEKRSPWTMPRLSQIPSLVGLSIRYVKFHQRLKRNNQRPCMDFFNQQPLRQIYGVPLGGIGGGSLNRGWQGDFCRWQLRPGIYEFDTTIADQFIVCIRKNNSTVYQHVLSIHKPQRLKSWRWGFPGNQAFYHALFPRAWTVYEIPEHGVVLTCKQVSPVIPHDYNDSSLPTAVFSWSVENKSNENLDVAIMMTMQNGSGSKMSRQSSGNYNRHFSLDSCSGVTMHNFTYQKMPYTMTVAAAEKGGVEVTSCLCFDSSGTGVKLWNDMHENGKLSHENEEQSHLTARGETIACAVSTSFKVQARNVKKNIDFSIAWDMPKVYFGGSETAYFRRYTKVFDSSGNVGPGIASYALQKYAEWEKKIEAWQNPILDSRRLPRWYKSALFNELYYITDGGTIWVEFNGQDRPGNVENHVNSNNAAANNNVEDSLRRADTVQQYGKFAYLEGQEYRMYNTYDVHFYASIALACLWPKLELSLQYDIAVSILSRDERIFHFLMDGDRNPVKSHGVVPHDVGDPDDEPWRRVNAYFVHDTAGWKDLNPKFVLQVYRDYHITGNQKFLADMWPVCEIVMQKTMHHDKDNDGLIENDGTADQTFDGWSVTGPSAYCGGLWIAALRCMVESAKILGLVDERLKYEDILKRATCAYQEKLWNGQYYNYDSNSRSNHNDSVMADQCAGQWYLLAADIADVLPSENVSSCLKKVYDFNVQKFANGCRGAVNGMRPNGKVDQSSVQSDEVWSGVTYAVAATMFHKGMFEEGFNTARGMYKSVWEEFGMAFQTPEAIQKYKHYRSLAYMRPLSIWGMQYALEHTKKDKGSKSISVSEEGEKVYSSAK